MESIAKDKMNKKEAVISRLKGRTDEEVEERFGELIRTGLNDEQWWDYVKTWLSTDNIVEDMDNWDIETKRAELEIIERDFLK